MYEDAPLPNLLGLRWLRDGRGDGHGEVCGSAAMRADGAAVVAARVRHPQADKEGHQWQRQQQESVALDGHYYHCYPNRLHLPCLHCYGNRFRMLLLLIYYIFLGGVKCNF